ncbi:hypothetical protein [Streptomyces spongiae]|uniref:Uncharacterized protein n=1 Tax=Streptomyces spongiae TaxID=565072 RepID=A0A5N8X8D0_9ACTN|nr:hypothetical protein [Streptomyces spongiae]MPY55731.1 hypothetical protein [Streptomyces spongiae]
MTPQQPAPIVPFVPVEPDADWETVRARVTDGLAATVPDAWSDHNPVDPGVTLAEVAAFGLADLHYRVAERHFDAWPLEVRGWEPDADRSWHATLPRGSLTAIAAALASSRPTSAAVLEPLIRACPSPSDAGALLSRPPWSAAFGASHRPAVIALMRARLVRQVAQEQAHIVAEAVAAQQGSADPVATRDARAAAELAGTLPLWDEEIVSLVRRERRRLTQEALVARLAEVRAATAATAPAVRAALAGDGLGPAEVRIAMAAGPRPPDTVPEDLEDPRGRTHIWPPHPIQSLTCEPVTAEDYARRARAHPGVRRAWAVPGRLEGVAWNGLPTGRLASVAVDPKAPAITLVVEPEDRHPTDRDEFLRAVLRTAVGPEAGTPCPDWRATVNDVAPRRVICDEVGAGLLAEQRVLVKGTLITGIGVDRAALVTEVRARISAYFAAGRPESRVPAAERPVDGPWPRIDQPTEGWIPGAPIRFTEVVEAIVADIAVRGVEDLRMKVEGGPEFVTLAHGSLPLAGNAVPKLADADCLRVRFALVTGCADA